MIVIVIVLVFGVCVLLMSGVFSSVGIFCLFSAVFLFIVITCGCVCFLLWLCGVLCFCWYYGWWWHFCIIAGSLVEIDKC